MCYTTLNAQQQARADEAASKYKHRGFPCHRMRRPRQTPSFKALCDDDLTFRRRLCPTQPNNGLRHHLQHVANVFASRLGAPGTLFAPCRPPEPRQTLGHIKHQRPIVSRGTKDKKPGDCRCVGIICSEQIHSSPVTPARCLTRFSDTHRLLFAFDCSFPTRHLTSITTSEHHRSIIANSPPSQDHTYQSDRRSSLLDKDQPQPKRKCATTSTPTTSSAPRMFHSTPTSARRTWPRTSRESSSARTTEPSASTRTKSVRSARLRTKAREQVLLDWPLQQVKQRIPALQAP
jgi:hypothetical protein